MPNKFPALGIEGNLNKQAEGMFDKMNGIGAHEVSLKLLITICQPGDASGEKD